MLPSLPPSQTHRPQSEDDDGPGLERPQVSGPHPSAGQVPARQAQHLPDVLVDVVGEWGQADRDDLGGERRRLGQPDQDDPEAGEVGWKVNHLTDRGVGGIAKIQVSEDLTAVFPGSLPEAIKTWRSQARRAC